jgi:hypothetical protein
MEYSIAVNNARLDAVETAIGTNAAVLIYTGPEPAEVDSAPTGTLLVAITLPTDWMGAASSETKAKAGTWSGTAVGNGTAGYFRLCGGSPTDVGGIQGNVDLTSASPTPDLGLDNTSITIGQTVTVSTFVITAGNR